MKYYIHASTQMNALHKNGKNVVVGGRRTSMRLERWCWEALADICTREGKTTNQLVTEISAHTQADPEDAACLSSAVRVFIMSYYRSAVPEGHRLADGLDALLNGLQSHRLDLPKRPGRPKRQSTTSCA